MDQNNESELVEKINDLAQSEFELIVIDSTNRTAYRRNTDWEWAGGDLYNSIGNVSKTTLESGVLHPRVEIEENFSEQIKGSGYNPTIHLGFGN